MSSLVKRNLKKKGNVEIHTNAMAKGVEEKADGVTVTFEVKGEEKTLMLITYLSLSVASKH
jgi:dihydrolipoamide dehydrogenase